MLIHCCAVVWQLISPAANSSSRPCYLCASWLQTTPNYSCTQLESWCDGSAHGHTYSHSLIRCMFRKKGYHFDRQRFGFTYKYLRITTRTSWMVLTLALSWSVTEQRQCFWSKHSHTVIATVADSIKKHNLTNIKQFFLKNNNKNNENGLFLRHCYCCLYLNGTKGDRQREIEL